MVMDQGQRERIFGSRLIGYRWIIIHDKREDGAGIAALWRSCLEVKTSPPETVNACIFASKLPFWIHEEGYLFEMGRSGHF